MRIVSVLVSLLVLVAQPAWAQPPSWQQVPFQLQQLEQRLAATATENPGEYGFAAMDLATGAIVSFNGETPFPMASTMKVAVAAAYLSQVDAGQRSLDDQYGSTTARSLMDAMITRSDNRATDQLIAMLGGPAVVDR